MANFVMETLPKLVALSSYVASALLYALALFTGSIVVRTAQPNGLAEVQVPFYLVSFLATWTALGVFFFGVVLSLAVLPRRNMMPKRPYVGSGLLSAGVLAILFGVFWYAVNVQDAGPRCLGGCAPSLVRYLQEILVASTIIGVLGLLAVGAGGWLLMKRTHPI